MATKETTINYDDIKTLVDKFNAEVTRRNLNIDKIDLGQNNHSNIEFNVAERLNNGRIQIGQSAGKYKESSGKEPEKCYTYQAYTPEDFIGKDLIKEKLSEDETVLCSGETIWADQYNEMLNDIEALSKVCACDNYGAVPCDCDSYNYSCSCYSVYIIGCPSNKVACPSYSCTCNRDNTTHVYSEKCGGYCSHCECNKVSYCNCEGV